MSFLVECFALLATKPPIEKDSKTSWFVCFGSFVLLGFSMTIYNSFGVLFVSLLDEFQESKTKIAWIGSFHSICSLLFSPVVSYLTRNYGYGRVVFLGNILFSLGLFVSSFPNHIGVLYVTYGLLLGTGTSFIYISAITVLPFCFQRHLATASGIVTSANGIFTLSTGPMYEYLIRRYGWRVSLRLLAIAVVPIGIGCVFFPNKEQILTTLEEEKKSVEKKISASLVRVLKNKAFFIWSVSMILIYLGVFVPSMHLISFSQDIGVPTQVSVYCVSCMWAFDTIGKISFGKLIDFFHWNIYTINSIAVLFLALTMTFLPLANAVFHLFLFASLFGLAMGVQSLLVLIITPDVTHPQDSKHAVTYLFAGLSIPGGVGPALAAWVYDGSRSYEIAFFVAGGFFAIASCLGVVLPSLIDYEDFNIVSNTKTEVELKTIVPHKPSLGSHFGLNYQRPKEIVFECLTVV